MQNIIYTLIAAALGGYVGIKLKLPAGAFIGSMFSVAAFNMTTGMGHIPVYYKTIAQIVVGGIIGLNFGTDTIKSLRKLLLPAVILASGLMVFNVLLGFAISALTGLDLTTSLFSCAPGGVTDMTLISEAYGADTPKVALLHLMRLVSVISVLPLVIGRFAKRFNRAAEIAAGRIEQ